MLAKLAFRNMKRSAGDYLVYLLTMTLVSALMYTFNGLLFQNELKQYRNTEGMMEMMVVLATLFIVLITAWLIGYMVRFLLEKRSGEFGIYLLLGMKKSALAREYLLENLLLGGISLLPGIGFGILFQQVLMTVLFSMLGMSYHLHISFHPGTVLMTVLCFGSCFLFSLLRCRRKFRKMNIRGLMEATRKNEEVEEKLETAKQLLLPCSILFLFLFWALFGSLRDTDTAALFLVGLILTIYLFYTGLSAWIICYIRKGGKKIYQGQNLFLLRQFASKIRTMQFTMGTLTALFTLALMGSSFALMFAAWQDKLMDQKFPFDILLYSPDPADTFEDEIRFLENRVTPLAIYPYRIYTDGHSQVNAWMLTHLTAWGTMYKNPDGSPAMDRIEKKLTEDRTYCYYDTYMGLTDYNHLRRMLGYEEISLGDTEYAVQVKFRLEKEVQAIGEDLRLAGADGASALSCAGIYADPFSQDGQNGGDYLVIVPDKVLSRMYPYYAELAVEIDDDAPPHLRDELDELRKEKLDLAVDPDQFVIGKESPQSNETINFPEDANFPLKGNRCYGSDTMIVFAAVNEVRDNLKASLAYMLASIMIPLFYVGLVFLCVAVTVLSVQQLSDSAVCKSRYDLLAKLGLKDSEIHKLILKQLAAYYLCPVLLAVLISGKMILFAGKRFVTATGIPVSSGSFFLKSIALFFGIYLIYFTVTCIVFRRNINGSG